MPVRPASREAGGSPRVNLALVHRSKRGLQPEFG